MAGGEGISELKIWLKEGLSTIYLQKKCSSVVTVGPDLFYSQGKSRVLKACFDVDEDAPRACGYSH